MGCVWFVISNATPDRKEAHRELEQLRECALDWM